ncbi:MAG TPA: metal ABC transporter permease [Acidimicrobiales bacterium]|nr:metal ABC transporter permease [Acidimicrobiales bacterium]
MTHVAALALAGPVLNPVDDLRRMLALHFMVNAFRAGTVVAVLAGTVGWLMVLRRQSFAGHTLAVVSFPGAAGAIWLGVSATAGYFAGSIAAALVIALVPRSASGGSRSQESAVIGTVQAFALACGALFASLYGGFLGSVTGLLFGSFLGVSDAQVVTLAMVAAAVLVVLAVLGRPLLFATVDGDVAAARGVPVRALSVAFLLLLGCAAAEVSQITGALLVFALLVMPAAAAQQVTARPAAGLALSVGFGVAVVWASLSVAFYSPWPVGFWVSTFGFALYVGAVGGRTVVVRHRRRTRTGGRIEQARGRSAARPARPAPAAGAVGA